MSCTPLQNVSINLLLFLFSRRYEEPTIGAAFLTQTVQDAENKVTVKFEIWDTAGQEKFHVITKAYYEGAHGIILTYDVTDQYSFENITYWMKNIEEHANTGVSKIIVGNKTDLEGTRAVS